MRKRHHDRNFRTRPSADRSRTGVARFSADTVLSSGTYGALTSTTWRCARAARPHGNGRGLVRTNRPPARGCPLRAGRRRRARKHDAPRRVSTLRRQVGAQDDQRGYVGRVEAKTGSGGQWRLIGRKISKCTTSVTYPALEVLAYARFELSRSTSHPALTDNNRLRDVVECQDHT